MAVACQVGDCYTAGILALSACPYFYFESVFSTFVGFPNILPLWRSPPEPARKYLIKIIHTFMILNKDAIFLAECDANIEPAL